MNCTFSRDSYKNTQILNLIIILSRWNSAAKNVYMVKNLPTLERFYLRGSEISPGWMNPFSSKRFVFRK